MSTPLTTKADLDEYRRSTFEFHRDSILLGLSISTAKSLRENPEVESLLLDFLCKNASAYADRIRFHYITSLLLHSEPKSFEELVDALAASARSFAGRSSTTVSQMKHIADMLETITKQTEKGLLDAERQSSPTRRDGGSEVWQINSGDTSIRRC